MKDILFKKKLEKIFSSKTQQEIIDHLKSKNNKLNIQENDIFFGEGYIRKKNEIPKYGVISAFDCYFPTLYHEVSHAIEIIDESPDRILLNTFGMNYKTKLLSMDEFYDLPITTQALDRECRVFAIQSKLMSYLFDIDEEQMLNYIKKDQASALYLMNDFLNIEADKELSENEKKEFRLRYLYDKIENYHLNIDINDILEKYKKVVDVRNYKEWTDEKLDEYSFHYIDIEQIKEYKTNFLNQWIELENEITEEDVYNCINKNEEELTNTPIWFSLFTNEDNKEEQLEIYRQNHIKKIAYFVKNKPNKPIDFEFLNDSTLELFNIDDGNHRLAGEFLKYKNRKYDTEQYLIKARIFGNIRRAKENYLWCPNVFAEELDLRNENYIKEYNKKIKDDFISLYKEKKEFSNYDLTLFDKAFYISYNKKQKNEDLDDDDILLLNLQVLHHEFGDFKHKIIEKDDQKKIKKLKP